MPGATDSQLSVTDIIANSNFAAANERLVSSGAPPTACEFLAGMHTAMLAFS